MLEMKCLGTIRSIVCISATFTQQIVGQIVLGRVVLGRVVFGISLACYLHSFHAENILDWLAVPFFSKGFRCTLMYLSYHIEINPKQPMTETSRIGTPPKFIQTKKSRPKWPKFCYLHSYHAEIIWTGLLSHSSAKKLLFSRVRIYGTSEAVHIPLKMSAKQIRFETGHNWVSGKCFAYMIRTFPKIIGFFTFKLEWNMQIHIICSPVGHLIKLLKL